MLVAAPLLALIVAILAPSAMWADDIPIPGKVLVVKPQKIVKFASKGTFALPAPGSAEDPTQGGAAIRIVDVSDSQDATYHLGRFGWKGLGNPPGSKGYRYRGKDDPAFPDAADACRSAVLRPDSIKAVCRGSTVALFPPFVGEGAVEISMPATDGSRTYCASFGGTEKKNDASALRRKDAPAPAGCLGPPQCGVDGFGECPDPFFCAILPPDPTYFCAPTFCNGGGSFPTCGGTCSGGWECKPVEAGGTGFCFCSPPAAPCDAACNGFGCPGGGACTFDPGGGGCGCPP